MILILSIKFEIFLTDTDLLSTLTFLVSLDEIVYRAFAAAATKAPAMFVVYHVQTANAETVRPLCH